VITAVAQGMDIPASADGADDLVPALLTAARALVGVCARSLARVQDVVTITQFRTMVVLQGHGDTRLNQFAERVGAAPSTSLRMVDRLIAARLVIRRENKADRREVLIALTVEGARLVREVSAPAGRDRHHRRRDAPAGSPGGGRDAQRVRPGRRRSHTEHRDFHPARLVTMAALSPPTQ
jgi:DNA-binding MarR family transcriptional regulator